jgi:saccharopine dehydrogenase-like NADP-dependent oxidoreductase
MRKKILILGGYGNFGERICKSLAVRSDICLIIAGRHKKKSEIFCDELLAENAQCELMPIGIDITSENLDEKLLDLKPGIVIHTSGPFQGQGYDVPKACIKAGSHYIDLADDRRFVCDFNSLNDAARDNKVCAISGASSVPGLSSAIIDHYIDEFSQLEEIDFVIVPGNKAVLGLATLSGILSYIGRPFRRWQDNKFVEVYACMDNLSSHFGEKLGRRYVANIDIPDLELFPQHYKGVSTVRFQAGLELPILHMVLSLMAIVSKVGLFSQWQKLAKPIFYLRKLFLPFGTGTGGMRIRLKGKDLNGKGLSIDWLLVAENNVGPYIPIIPTIILANKLIDKEMEQSGAMPCLGLFTRDEFSQIAEKWGIYQLEERVSE